MLRHSLCVKYLSWRDGLYGFKACYRLPEQFAEFPGRIVKQSMMRNNTKWPPLASTNTLCNKRCTPDIGAASSAGFDNNIQIAVRAPKACSPRILQTISGSTRQAYIAAFDEQILELRRKPIPRRNENWKSFLGERLVQHGKAVRQLTAHIVNVPRQGIFACRVSLRRMILVNPSMHKDIDIIRCTEVSGKGLLEMTGDYRKTNRNARVSRKGKQTIQRRRAHLGIVVSPPKLNFFMARKLFKRVDYRGHDIMSALLD